MGFRRRARELAMQALYYMDMRSGDLNEKMSLFRKLHAPPEKSNTFFHELVNGVLRNRKELDTIIENYSSNWKISRMPCVDRNILRIAVYEMLALDDIPVKVSINEAIDIGKKYGTQDSGAFINGILDGIHQAWDQGHVTFKPSVASAVNDSGEGGLNATANKAENEKLHQKIIMDSDPAPHRLIRLAPGLRKRMAVRSKDPLKEGGDYDS